MIKMDMVWVAVAGMLHPETSAAKTVTLGQIEAEVAKLFGASVARVVIEGHLVSWEDRQALQANPQRGGSRNRYLFRTGDGTTPARDGSFRLYKAADSKHDGWEKTGPTHPDAAAVPADYRYLVAWYETRYAAIV